MSARDPLPPLREGDGPEVLSLRRRLRRRGAARRWLTGLASLRWWFSALALAASLAAGSAYRCTTDGSSPTDTTAPTTASPTVSIVAPQTLGASVTVHLSWAPASDASGISGKEAAPRNRLRREIFTYAPHLQMPIRLLLERPLQIVLQQRPVNARLRKRPHLDVDPLQVEQHAHHDVATRGRREERSAKGHLIADVLLEQRLELVR